MFQLLSIANIPLPNIPLPIIMNSHPYVEIIQQHPSSTENGKNQPCKSPHAGSYCPLLEEMGSKANTHHFPEENGRNDSTCSSLSASGSANPVPVPTRFLEA